MSAAAVSQVSWPAIHEQFVAALPQMENTIRYQFRNWPKRRRDEAIADTRAAAWHSWFGLVVRGKDPQDVGPTAIAYNASRYVKNGRRLGCGTIRRGGMDVYHPRAQRRLGFHLISLNHDSDLDCGESPDTRRERLAADHRWTPADAAAFAIDYQAWKETLPPRKRKVAELLAEGHQTSVVAAMLGVSPGAVSQSRTWQAESWRKFQAEVAQDS
jgi:hypothetical protein